MLCFVFRPCGSISALFFFPLVGRFLRFPLWFFQFTGLLETSLWNPEGGAIAQVCSLPLPSNHGLWPVFFVCSLFTGSLFFFKLGVIFVVHLRAHTRSHLQSGCSVGLAQVFWIPADQVERNLGVEPPEACGRTFCRAQPLCHHLKVFSLFLSILLRRGAEFPSKSSRS